THAGRHLAADGYRGADELDGLAGRGDIDAAGYAAVDHGTGAGNLQDADRGVEIGEIVVLRETGMAAGHGARHAGFMLAARAAMRAHSPKENAAPCPELHPH